LKSQGTHAVYLWSNGIREYHQASPEESKGKRGDDNDDDESKRVIEK